MALKQLPKIYSTDFRLPNKKPVGDVELESDSKLADFSLVGSKSPYLLKSNRIMGNFKGTPVVSGGSVSVNNASTSLGINNYSEITGYPFYMFLDAIPDGASEFALLMADPAATNKSFGIAGDTAGGVRGFVYNVSFNAIPSTVVTPSKRIKVLFVAPSSSISTWEFWVDGVKTQTGVSGTVAFPTSTSNLALGELRRSVPVYYGGTYFSFGIYNGTLTTAEARELTTKPYITTLKPKQQPVYFTAEAGGTITVNGATPNYTYASVAGSIDLTGLISVTGSTPNYAYSPISGTIDLTPQITVTGATPNYTYTAIAGTVETPGTISVTGVTPNCTYSSVAGTITLFGTITVTGETPNYSYASVRGVIQFGENVYTNSFVGFVPNQGVFSGVVKSATFSGIISETSDFSGYAKVTTFLGVKQ